MPILYHLSPERFDQFSTTHMGDLFRGTSKRVGEKGIYLAPSFRDALKWVPTISGVKGSRSRNQSKKQQRVNQEFKKDERESPIPYPPRNQSRYKTLFLYKVEVPRNILERIKEHNRDWNNKAGEDDSLSFGYIGSWDPEIFVPEEYVPYLNIVGVKKYETDKLMSQVVAEENRVQSKGYEEYLYRSWSGKDRPAPTPPEDYDRVLDARKIFDSQFSQDQTVLIDGQKHKIQELSGRNVRLWNFWNYNKYNMDIIEFVERAQVIPEQESDSWYKARRRSGELRKIS